MCVIFFIRFYLEKIFFSIYFAHNPPPPAPITLVVQGMAVRRHFPYFGFAFLVYTASLMHIYAIFRPSGFNFGLWWFLLMAKPVMCTATIKINSLTTYLTFQTSLTTGMLTCLCFALVWFGFGFVSLWLHFILVSFPFGFISFWLHFILDSFWFRFTKYSKPTCLTSCM